MCSILLNFYINPSHYRSCHSFRCNFFFFLYSSLYFCSLPPFVSNKCGLYIRVVSRFEDIPPVPGGMLCTSSLSVDLVCQGRVRWWRNNPLFLLFQSLHGGALFFPPSSLSRSFSTFTVDFSFSLPSSRSLFFHFHGGFLFFPPFISISLFLPLRWISPFFLPESPFFLPSMTFFRAMSSICEVSRIRSL